MLFIASYSPNAVGGVGQFMIDLGAFLTKQGIRVGMCYRSETEEFTLPNRIRSAERIAVSVGRSRATRTPIFLLRTVLAVFRARTRYRVFHLIVPQPMTAVAALVARIAGIKCLVTVFAPYPKTGRRASDVLHRISEKLVLRLADVIVFECEATRNQFGHAAGVVILNGIDTTFYRPIPEGRAHARSAMGIEPNTAVVLYAGRVAESKGVGDLLEAFATLPDECLERSQLVLVGPIEAPRLDRPENRARLRGRLTLIGPVGKDAVRDYYLTADLFALPSYREGISSSLIEAMSCGLPAVVSNVGGNSEVVRDSREGFLFQPHDVERLRTALGYLISNEHRRLEMAGQARERICESFDLTVMAQRYASVYASLLGDVRTSGRLSRLH